MNGFGCRPCWWLFLGLKFWVDKFIFVVCLRAYKCAYGFGGVTVNTIGHVPLFEGRDVPTEHCGQRGDLIIFEYTQESVQFIRL